MNREIMNSAKFIEGITTLLSAWGGDTPPEAIWAANELLDFYKGLKQKEYLLYFDEEDDELNSQVLEEITKW